MVTTKVIVFPVRGRRWAFAAQAATPVASSSSSSSSSSSVSQLWKRLLSVPKFTDRAQLLEQYVSTKMHDKWAELGAQPSESIRHRIYSIGQRLLCRLPSSEQFLKTIPKETNNIDLIFPTSLNPRLVRRRVRHLAQSGAIYHQRLMYGSMGLLPFTILLGVLPLPNVVFFWNLFRTHAHWRALQGSTRLQMLVTDSETQASIAKYDSLQKGEAPADRSELAQDHIGDRKSTDQENGQTMAEKKPWVYMPATKLDLLVNPTHVILGSLDDSSVTAICQEYHLDPAQVLKWRDDK